MVQDHVSWEVVINAPCWVTLNLICRGKQGVSCHKAVGPTRKLFWIAGVKQMVLNARLNDRGDHNRKLIVSGAPSALGLSLPFGFDNYAAFR
jgi:hypothetical protein